MTCTAEVVRRRSVNATQSLTSQISGISAQACAHPKGYEAAAPIESCNAPFLPDTHNAIQHAYVLASGNL